MREIVDCLGRAVLGAGLGGAEATGKGKRSQHRLHCGKAGEIEASVDFAVPVRIVMLSSCSTCT